MKRFFKWLTASFACLTLLFLVACSNITQSYADKINKATENGESITLEQVRKDLGDECVEILVLNNGVVIGVKGCKTADDLSKKLENEEDVEGIVITIALGKAKTAAYRKITLNDLK